jgi:rare lipoprotein A (peptidoglycan hydrolase)
MKKYINAWSIMMAVVVALLTYGAIEGTRQGRIQAAKDQELGQLRTEVNDLHGEVAQLRARIRALELTIHRQSMIASWYGPGFHGRRASDGNVFDQAEFTCAHRTLPLGTIVIIEYKGKLVPAMVTDRGPFIKGRDIDLSLSIARRLGMVAQGVVEVRVYTIHLWETKP